MVNSTGDISSGCPKAANGLRNSVSLCWLLCVPESVLVIPGSGSAMLPLWDPEISRRQCLPNPAVRAADSAGPNDCTAPGDREGTLEDHRGGRDQLVVERQGEVAGGSSLLRARLVGRAGPKLVPRLSSSADATGQATCGNPCWVRPNARRPLAATGC